MLTVFILEDEAPALRRLREMLASTEPGCRIAGSADSVRSAAAWLGQNPAPDLILADIQLGDGLSLDLFRTAPPPCPVIFVTAHDDYLLEAFATHGIAYLLKPVKRTELEGALAKYRSLGRHFAGSLAALVAALAEPPHAPRQRVLAQRGPAFQPVAVADIAYFLSESKLTFLVTRAGERCLVNEPLATLAAELGPAQFFRLNRNCLAYIAAVKSFTSVGKGRLSVQLVPRPADEVIVSQENAAAFRAWAGR